MASLHAQLKAAHIYMCVLCVGGGRLVSQKSSCCESCCARFSRGTGPETPGESPAGPGPKLPANLPRNLARNSREGLPRARAQDSRGDLPHPGLGFKVWPPTMTLLHL